MRKIKTFLFFLLNIFFVVRICLALSLKEEARIYRQKGYEAQRSGDLDSAFIYYQKAIQIDPSYATAYNDLGVIYEMKGDLDKAEDSYLKAIELNPEYLPTYSNLASLYERKEDFLKANEFWKKRIQLGNPEDIWTQKAKEKRRALAKFSPEIKKEIVAEDALELSKKILEGKRKAEEERIVKIKSHLDLGMNYYSKGKYEEAIKEFKEVLALDPENSEAKDFIEKSIHKTTELKIRELAEKGIEYYTAKDYSSAVREFKKILIYLHSTKGLSEKISK